jgi:hypothetical protein
MAEELGHHDQVLSTGEGRLDRRALAGQADQAADLAGMSDGIDAADPQRAMARSSTATV